MSSSVARSNQSGQQSEDLSQKKKGQGGVEEVGAWHRILTLAFRVWNGQESEGI